MPYVRQPRPVALSIAVIACREESPLPRRRHAGWRAPVTPRPTEFVRWVSRGETK